METIDLSELINYEAALIQEMLLPLIGERLELVLPKQPPCGVDETNAPVYMYAEAAYIGHLLGLVSETFAYHVPCPAGDEPFRFLVDCRQMADLVETIHYIVNGHFFDNSDENDEFTDKYSQYFADTDDVPACAASGLLEIALDELCRINEDNSADRYDPSRQERPLDAVVSQPVKTKEIESIDLTEFRNYSLALTEEFLASFAGQRLEIVLPKLMWNEAPSVYASAFYAYAAAAYIGHILSEASERFSYYVPCVTLLEPFRFYLDCRNIPALAKAIHGIITGHFYHVTDNYSETTKENIDFYNSIMKHYRSAVDYMEGSYIWGLIYEAMHAEDNMSDEEKGKSPFEI